MSGSEAVETSRTGIAGRDATLWGAGADRVVLAVHGIAGHREDEIVGRAARAIVPLGWQVVSVDLAGHGEREDPEDLLPWIGGPELGDVFDELASGWGSVGLYACSLGAYFALTGLGERAVERAAFEAPLVDMAAHITRMMRAHGVTVDRLRDEGVVPLADGQYLSWEYREYARARPVRWAIPSTVLRGDADPLVPRGDVDAFVAASGATLAAVAAGHYIGGEHDALVQAWLADFFA